MSRLLPPLPSSRLPSCLPSPMLQLLNKGAVAFVEESVTTDGRVAVQLKQLLLSVGVECVVEKDTTAGLVLSEFRLRQHQ